MKNTKLIFITIVISLTLACGRYDEGPMISFRSVEKRVANHYILDEFTKNGIDMTQELADSVGKEWWFLTKEEAAGYINDLMVYPTDSILPYLGIYYISDNKKNIEMYIYSTGNYNTDYIGMDPFEKYNILTWRIERLKKDEMWLSCTYNNADYYLKFEIK